jgi:hypothetical protein
MKRRKFIFLTAAGFAVISLPACNYLIRDKIDNPLADPKSLSHIWDEENILNIGNKYRSLFSDESDEQSLTKLLQGEFTIEEEVIEGLKLKIKNDFQTSNTIMIDGWILSQTETRQCALYSILNSNT